MDLLRELRAARDGPSVRMQTAWTMRPSLVPFDAPSTAEWRSRWLAATRWRRRVEKALAHSRLTFTQWQVLEAAAAPIDETGDAVSQNQFAARTELDRTTISRVMRTLDKKYLVDRVRRRIPPRALDQARNPPPERTLHRGRKRVA